MADDITLTVRVRDMSHGEFQRLDRQLDRMRRDLRGVTRDTDSAGMHSRRLTQDIDKLGEKFKKMQETGRLSRRELSGMRDDLDAMSRSALNAARSGEITHDRYHSLNREIGSMRAQLHRLGGDLDRNSTSVRRSGDSVRRMGDQTLRTVRMVNGMTRSITQSTRSVDGNTRVISTWRQEAQRAEAKFKAIGDNSNFAGNELGSMRSKLIAVAVVLAASVLPTIGALAPMLAGIGAIAGVAALAFMGLSRPTKQLTSDQRKFKQGLKPLTNEFRQLQRTAQKAVLSGLTRSLKDIGRAMKAMNPVIKIGGDALGRLVDKIAKGLGSKDFMGPFVKNVKIGTDWVIKFAGSFGKFLKAFFEFGTKSKPALDAWQDLLGGFMDRGLPGMFKNMEDGVKGASDYLHGLASVINDGLLPGLGKLIGTFMKVFGPTLGTMLTTAAKTFTSLVDIASQLMVVAAPLAKPFIDMGEAMAEIGRVGLGSLASLLKNLGGGLAKSMSEAFGGTGFTSLTESLKNNEAPLRAVFTGIGDAVFTMAQTIVQVAPSIMDVFTRMTAAALTTFGVFVHGAADAFGWVPGLGPKMKDASKSFDDFSKSVTDSLSEATAASATFRDVAGPNLSRAHLQFDVDQAKAAITDIKDQLKDPELTKKRRAILEADKTLAERSLRQAEAKLKGFDKKRAKAKINANADSFFNVVRRANSARVLAKTGKIAGDPRSFFNVLGRVNRARALAKTAPIKANASGFWAAVHAMSNKVLGTSYINIQKTVTTIAKKLDPFHNADGAIYTKKFANGGENHDAQIAPAGAMRVWAEPETGGEAYIPLSPSKRHRSRGIAEKTVDALGGDVQWFAKGGLSKKQKAQQKAQKEAQKQEKDARSQMGGQFGISFFGKIAGYKHTPYEVSTGKPESLGSLVSALNGLRGQIKAAFHGRQESSLLHQLTRAGKSLIKYEKKLGDVNKKLDAAKTKLDGLKQAAASLRDSVKSGVMSATDITRVAGNDTNVTLTDVMAAMHESLDKSTAFSGALTSLKSKGVSKDIINQIAEAGISGGGLETAGALLSASDSDIAQINEMQKQINANAASAGKTASDAMYGAGIKAAEGLVAGLTKKQKDIEKAMMRIAKSMEKALKHALGIKSPSRVMMKVGHHTAEGFALGIAKNRRVSNAWSSMLNVPSTGGTSRSAHGDGGQYVFPIYVGGKFFDEVILDTNRRVVRTRGGDVQKVFGRK